MNGEKKWYQSKGVIGGIVSTVCVVLMLAGVGVTEGEQADLTDKIVQVIEAIGALGGAVFGVYGRLKAEKKLTA